MFLFISARYASMSKSVRVLLGRIVLIAVVAGMFLILTAAGAWAAGLSITELVWEIFGLQSEQAVTVSGPTKNVIPYRDIAARNAASSSGPSFGTCSVVVINTNSSGSGSLREAIVCANSNADTNTISFAIPGTDAGCSGSGVCTITPSGTVLPGITKPVIIDGYTQANATPNTNAFGLPDNAALKIELSGSNFSTQSGGVPFRIGLTFKTGSSGSSVSGLVVNRWGDAGIYVNPVDFPAAAADTSGNMTFTGNFIGLNPDGTHTGVGNTQAGILISNSSGNTIGGTAPAARNVISGVKAGNGSTFESSNLLIQDTGATAPQPALLVVQGNYIGTDATGTLGTGTGSQFSRGLALEGIGNGNTIGGTIAGAGNLISGNGGGGGIYVTFSEVIIQGNLVGTKADGTGSLPNADGAQIGAGIKVSGPNSIIGGPSAAAANIVKNSSPGIDISSLAVAQGNTISDNTNGVSIGGGSLIGNTITNNNVGAATYGVRAVGINATIMQNTITGSRGTGVMVDNGNSGSPRSGNTISNNTITGTTNPGGSGQGILVGSWSTLNMSISGNTIQGNAGPGVEIKRRGDISPGNGPFGVSVLGNSIFNNGGLGIDLNCAGETGCLAGVTGNDTGDTDPGPNNLQNYPVLTSVVTGGASTAIQGTLNSNNSGTYRIQFFSSSASDPTGNGEGDIYLGELTGVTTDGSGNTGTFTFNTATPITPGHVVTSTATDAAGNTSEFSLFSGAATPTPTPTSTNTPTSTPTATATNTPTPTPTVPAVSGTVTYGNAVSGPPPPRPVSNVLISGAGSPNVSATTAFPDGTYSLIGFGAGAYTVTPTKTTGQNNITSFDAARIAQHVSGVSLLTGSQLLVADVSNNGTISSFDAGEIANYVVTAAPAGITGSWKFSPVNRTYPSVGVDIPNQDYTALLMGEVSGNWTNTGARPGDNRQRQEAAAGDSESGSRSSGPERGVAITLPHLVTPADNEVLIPVSIQGSADKGIISYEFDLRYDPSVIQPLPDPVAVAGTISSKLSIAIGAGESGLLRVAVYGPRPIDGSGILLNLRFTAIGVSGSVSPLKWEKMMFNEGDPQTTVADGRIELSAAAPNQAEISGRLLTSMGQGVPTARVILTDSAGLSRSVPSNGFGVYRFGGLQVGQTYTISVDAKRHTFTPMTLSVPDQVVIADMIEGQ